MKPSETLRLRDRRSFIQSVAKTCLGACCVSAVPGVFSSVTADHHHERRIYLDQDGDVQ